MKQLLFLTFFYLSFLSSFGQACGKYRIKYLGTIQSEIRVKKVKLLSIFFRHGVGEKMIELLPEGKVFEIDLLSHLTSHHFSEPYDLLEFNKQHAGYFPITLTIIEAGQERNIRVKPSWDDIEITLKEDEGFGNLFEINLGELGI
ncbi:MAG: hypothetical protein GY816_19815 [Cytophagales bacterium]|nr:hypothetical protein [Cytophagales bacterium]